MPCIYGFCSTGLTTYSEETGGGGGARCIIIDTLSILLQARASGPYIIRQSYSEEKKDYQVYN